MPCLTLRSLLPFCVLWAPQSGDVAKHDRVFDDPRLTVRVAANMYEERSQGKSRAQRSMGSRSYPSLLAHSDSDGERLRHGGKYVASGMQILYEYAVYQAKKTSAERIVLLSATQLAPRLTVAIVRGDDLIS